jgi:DNA primase
MEALMKEFGISGDKVGTKNQYLAKCPFHDQEASFLIDAKTKEYFCFCEGLRGDVFSFVINYDRDVNHKHMTLKQAVDYLMEKFPIQ